MSANFTQSQVETLIDLVKENDNLYYEYNYERNVDQWNQIGVVLNKSGKDCSERWYRMRDFYFAFKMTGRVDNRPAVQQRLQRLSFLSGTNILNIPITSSDSNATSSIIVDTTSIVGDNNSLVVATAEPIPTPMDAIDHFLKSIGDTIKHFPPMKLCEVKLKIMNAVSEVEMKGHRDRESFVSSEYLQSMKRHRDN